MISSSLVFCKLKNINNFFIIDSKVTVCKLVKIFALNCSISHDIRIIIYRQIDYDTQTHRYCHFISRIHDAREWTISHCQKTNGCLLSFLLLLSKSFLSHQDRSIFLFISQEKKTLRTTNFHRLLLCEF